MKLTKDIELYSNLNEDIKIYRSEGILNAEELDLDDYTKNALLPKPNWINNIQKIETIRHSKVHEINTSMFYGKLSDNFILLVDKLKLKLCEDIQDAFSFFQQNESLSRYMYNQ